MVLQKSRLEADSASSCTFQFCVSEDEEEVTNIIRQLTRLNPVHKPKSANLICP